MDPKLFLTDFGFTLSILISLGAGVIVYFKGRGNAASRSFFFLMIAVSVFQLAHVVGVNLANGVHSRFVLMFTTATILTACFTTRMVLAVLGELERRRSAIRAIYAVGLGLIAFFALFPNYFLHPSRPKLYLPNYYEPGIFYWLLIAFFAITAIYFFGLLISKYFKSSDDIFRNRIKYFFLSILFGYTAGSFGFPLVYDIPVDPIWMMFIGLYTVPLGYGVLKYELMDIKVVAKQAFVYGVVVGVVSVVINAVSFANNILLGLVPRLSPWLLPVVTSILAVSVGSLVWRRLRELDALKYEFITVVTHKFRTPLTYVKWALENLLEKKLPQDEKQLLAQIDESNKKLVRLTDVLVSAARADDSGYRYVFTPISASELLGGVVSGLREKFRARSVSLNFSEDSRLGKINGDSGRLSFVFQVLLLNSLLYTPKGGSVHVALRSQDSGILVRVQDSGIGITREESPRIFQKFFRGSRAKLADTEGLGIGLFIARSIISRHHGKIWFESAGESRGATFFVTLPTVGSRS